MKIFSLGRGEVKLVTPEVEAASIICSSYMDNVHCVECRWHKTNSKFLKKFDFQESPMAPENVFRTTEYDASWLEKNIIRLAENYGGEELYWRAEPQMNLSNYFNEYVPYKALGIAIILKKRGD